MTSPALSTRTSAALSSGVVSLLGGLLGGWMAFRLYIAVASPADPDIDLVSASLLMIGRLLIVALVSMLGFVVGSISAMSLELIVRRADRAFSAVGLALVAEVALVPAAAAAVVWVSETGVESPIWLWLAVGIVGGVVPAVARWFTFVSPDAVAA